MKKLILFAAILFAGVSVVNADVPETPSKVETSTATTENVNLKVTLNPIQTIEAVTTDVHLVYASITDYTEGVTVQKDGHLKVYSTGGFLVSVKSEDDNLSNSDNTATIPASTISVEASKNRNTSDDFTSKGVKQLNSSSQDLFTNAKGGAELTYSIDYVGGTLNDYIDKLYNATSASVFETTVTYTITAL